MEEGLEIHPSPRTRRKIIRQGKASQNCSTQSSPTPLSLRPGEQPAFHKDSIEALLPPRPCPPAWVDFSCFWSKPLIFPSCFLCTT